MFKTKSIGLVLGVLGFVTGCESVVDDKPYCADGPGEICAPAGFPFVTSAGTLTDCQTTPGCTSTKTTATLSQPQAGTVCLKGTVAASPVPSGGPSFAWLLLSVNSVNQSKTQIVEVFDAKALGITGLQFTIESPPATGVTLFATAAHTSSCSSPPECLSSWSLTTGRADVVKAFQTAGPESAPFSSFLMRTDPNRVLDSSALSHFIFEVGPGDYDFCVSGLSFVNASGETVSP
jgi:hypothetical protein